MLSERSSKPHFDDKIQPTVFLVGRSIDSWTQLQLHVVDWLAHEGYLTRDKLPIHNHAKRGKYVVNDKPEHSTPDFDGDWHEVSGGFYVDTKYNAQSHINNLLSTLEQVGCPNPPFSLGFRVAE